MHIKNVDILQKAFDLAKRKLEQDEDDHREIEDLKEYKALLLAQDNMKIQ